jgi:hypothetical protein
MSATKAAFPIEMGIILRIPKRAAQKINQRFAQALPPEALRGHDIVCILRQVNTLYLVQVIPPPSKETTTPETSSVTLHYRAAFSAILFVK